MATLLLNDKAARAARAPKGSRLEFWDTKVANLCLRVSDTGHKVWVIRYRSLDGRQPRLILGDFTDRQGVRWAREQSEDIRTAVRRGADPAAERKAKKAAERSRTLRTFDDLADTYLAACRGGDWMPKGKRESPRTIRDAEGILKRHIRPVIGAVRLEDVSRTGVRQLLRDMRDSGIRTQVNRAQATIRQVFAFGISEFEGRLVTVNPAIGAPIVAETSRRRIFSDEELRQLWAALKTPSTLRAGQGRPLYVSRARAIALQLAMLLLQRRGEISGIRESEINETERTWTVAPDRMKNRRPHVVPLPARALELIAEARELALAARERKAMDTHGAANDWPLFPSSWDATKPMHPDSMTHALARVLAALGIGGASTHDLRRTGSTALTSERIGASGFTRSLV